jgi:hypothetical protein
MNSNKDTTITLIMVDKSAGAMIFKEFKIKKMPKQ